jgi:hypothetical protein
MSNNNKGIADPGNDEDDSQDVHHHVVSCVIADLIGDREGCGWQHEMGQDFHAPFSEHEVGDNNAYETYDSNKIIDGLHWLRPTLSTTSNC